MLELFTKEGEAPINLVLLRWYDVWPKEGYNERDEEQELYGCPRLWLTNQYTCVYLDSVDISMHIIQRNNRNNEYLVNRYIF